MPEVFNRLDKVLVCNTLSQTDLAAILDLEINALQGRLATSAIPILLSVAPDVRTWLVRQGYDPRYGARHLKRALLQHVETPLANIITSGQVEAKAHVAVTLAGHSELEFTEL